MPDVLTDLQRAGALARAAGRSPIDNPAFFIDNLPAATGEPLGEWSRKEEAWRLGWTMEDMMREHPIRLGPLYC